MKNESLVLMEDSKEYIQWKTRILNSEQILLASLCFDLKVELPHYDALKLVHKYNGKNSDMENNSRLRLDRIQ